MSSQRTNSPVGKNRHHHRTKFLQRILPHAFEQFRAGHVTNECALDFLLLLGRVIERVAQKNVGVALITRIARDDRIECFGKSNFLHNSVSAYDTRQRTREQAAGLIGARSTINRAPGSRSNRDKLKWRRGGAIWAVPREL